MKQITIIILTSFIVLSVCGQTSEVQYRKRYTNIPNDPNTDDLADPNRSGSIAYELDGHPSGGGLSTENFQVLDIGIWQRRFQLARKWTSNELYFRSTNTSGVLGDFSRIWHSDNSNLGSINWAAKDFIAYNQSDNSSTLANTAKYNAYGLLGNRGSIYITNGASNGDIRFGVGNTHGVNNIMFMNSTGLSIKTGAIPTEALDVNGNIKANKIHIKAMEVNNTYGAGTPSLILNNTYHTFDSHEKEDQRPLVLRRGTNNNESLSTFVHDTYTYFVYENDESASAIQFRLINNDAEHSDGSNKSDRTVFRIGSNKTDGYIQVNGYILADEIRVEDIAATNMNLSGDIAANNITLTSNGQTADFVFSDSYNLKPLSEVESFIKANKHLPEIPSAAQMEEQGVNLAEMNKLLLQKVEELTLYSIEMEKQVKELKETRGEMEDRLSKLEHLLLKE